MQEAADTLNGELNANESKSRATLAVPPAAAPLPASSAHLDALYPTHASTLSILLEKGYKDAYKMCLRTRILMWVIEDLGANSQINSMQVMRWISQDSLKTHQNNISRVNVARRVLEHLRGLPRLDGQDLADMQSLAVLLEGPLSPIPLDRANRDESVDHKSLDIALRLSISKLEQINKRFKPHL